MRIFYAFLIIICVSCNSSTSKSNLTIEDQRYIDSVCQYYKGLQLNDEQFEKLFNKKLKILGNCQDTISRYYLNKIVVLCVNNNLTSGADLIIKLKNSSLKYNDELNYARSLRLYAALNFSLGNKSYSIQLNEKALRIAEKLNNEEEVIKIYNSIALALYGLDDYEGAEYFFEKALNKNNKKNIEIKLNSYKGLILNLNEGKKTAKVISLVNKIFFTYKLNLKPIDITFFKYQLALAYEEKKDFKISYKLVNEVRKSANFSSVNLPLKIDIERLYLRLSRKFNESKSFEKDYKYLNSLSDQYFFKGVKSSLLVDYGFHLSEINKNKKALFIANEAYTLSSKLNYTYNSLNALALMAKIDTLNSYNYFQKFDSLNDVLISKRQKNFSKILIDTQEVERARESAEKQKKIILFTTICIIMILLLLYAIYRNRVISLKYDLNKKHQKSSELIQDLIVQNQAIEVEARQNEQRRIAMEIHDNVLNQLASVRYKLFKLNFSQDTKAVIDALQGVENIRQVEVELRNLTHNLTHQSQNDNVSIHQMIHQLITVHEEIYNQKIKLNIDDWNWEGLSSEVKLCFVRIIQEALFNCAKHAKAQNIEIDFNYTKDSLSVQIKDDGKGFNIDGNYSGIGLQNLAIRAAQIQAMLHIQSEKKQGTVIKIEKKIV